MGMAKGICCKMSLAPGLGTKVPQTNMSTKITKKRVIRWKYPASLNCRKEIASSTKMGGSTSPTALKMAVIFANRIAASESGMMENEPSEAAGWATQKTPIPISIIAETKLAQMPVLMCLGRLLSISVDDIPFLFSYLDKRCWKV